MAHSRIIIAIGVSILLQATLCSAQAVWSGYSSRSTAVIDVDSCRRTITILDPTLFRSGDHLLLHQTVSIKTGIAGLCEWSIVDTVIGHVVYLTTSRVHSYDASFGLQAIQVLFARSGIVVDTLRTIPWNGLHGGIIAIECADSLFVNGVVDVYGTGCRGGRPSLNTLDTAETFDTISARTRLLTDGEGEGWAKGGLARNAGGGGGSLFGSGGRGGFQTSAYGNLDRGGAGGNALTLVNNQPYVLIGSGGGSGHQNDFNGSSGGRGGGIIIMKAPVIVSNSNAGANLSGEHARDAREDGAGGGGSGGTLVLLADTVKGLLPIDISGGNGGSVRGVIYHYGPGGGGGGGVVASKTQRLFQQMSITQRGGSCGNSMKAEEADTNNYGATNGMPGGTTFGARIPIGQIRRDRISLRANDTIVDEGASTILAAKGGVSYRWRGDVVATSAKGDSVATNALYVPTWFVVEITTVDGCVVIDSVLVQPRVSALPKLTISVDDAKAAPGDTVDLYVRIKSEPSNVRTITGTVFLSMRSTTLIPVRSALRTNDSTIQMSFPIRLDSRSGSSYRRATAIAALGDSLKIVLRIDSVRLDTTVRDLRLINGTFTLDGICIENGKPRLLARNTPMFTIQGRTITTEADELLLFDLAGKRVTIESVRTGSILSALVPDVATGAFFMTLIKDGLRHTIGVVIE
ncbi:MAG: hypothetical protein H7X70_04400 [Candidatus Kapabacteria bacterium]|nr:hypothetical protein [Candidatus Kapabacteria bacterium]